MQNDKVTAIHGDEPVEMHSGTIESIDGRQFRILTEWGHISARRAFSCLIEPQPGDTVLVSTGPRMRGFILSILERPKAQDTQLDFPGDVTLKAASGRLHLHSEKGVSLSSTNDIDLASRKISIHADKGLFAVDKINAVASALTARVQNIQTFAHTLETVAEHWLQKLKNSFRRIEVVDQLKARNVLHTVDNLYSMKSKQATVLAEKDIKIDAERIHMG